MTDRNTDTMIQSFLYNYIPNNILSKGRHGFGLDIVLPFVYKINEKWGFGADICICSSGGKTTEGTGEYEFWNHNVFNAFFDYHL